MVFTPFSMSFSDKKIGRRNDEKVSNGNVYTRRNVYKRLKRYKTHGKERRELGCFGIESRMKKQPAHRSSRSFIIAWLQKPK